MKVPKNDSTNLSTRVRLRDAPVYSIIALVVILSVAFVVGACSSPGTDSATEPETTQPASDTATTQVSAASSKTLRVALVGNPQMYDLADLTPEFFTAKSGIGVEYSILEESTLRQILSRDFPAGDVDFDVIMLGMYEAPLFGANGWLYNLSPYAESDETYELDDLIPSVRQGLSVGTSLYASPFSGESSFLMYRKDLLDAAGITISRTPTWDEVATAARQLDSDEVAGICLRAKPGWGEAGAPLTTVLNTFGGTWWLANPDGSIGRAQVDQPEFREAVEFYTGLIADAGEDDAASVGYKGCLDHYLSGSVAMWYDATVAASSLEADDSPVKGKNGYSLAPTHRTDASGWLWAWALAIPATAPDPDSAWEFISWATGPDYAAQAAKRVPGGWPAVPPATRISTYSIPEYRDAAGAFADITLEALDKAPIDDPGTTPRPGLPGVQYVGVPEFEEVGNQCTEWIAGIVSGERTIEDALDRCQDFAASFSTEP